MNTPEQKAKRAKTEREWRARNKAKIANKQHLKYEEKKQMQTLPKKKKSRLNKKEAWAKIVESLADLPLLPEEIQDEPVMDTLPEYAPDRQG